MDCARTPPPLHAEPGGMITYLLKKRTSNQEGGPRRLRSGLMINKPLPNMAGSAAERPYFFLLNGVVGDGPRAHSTCTSLRAGRDDHQLKKKKAVFDSRRRTSGAQGQASDHSPLAECGWKHRGKIDFHICQRRSSRRRKWTACVLHLNLTQTQSRAG